MNITTRLILVAVLPAVLVCILVMFKAIQDMGEQRAVMLATLEQTLSQQPNISKHQLVSTVRKAGETMFNEQAKLAIPVLSLATLALIGLCLFFVKRITQGLSIMLDGIIRMSSPDEPLTFRLNTEQALEMKGSAENINNMLDRIEQALREVKQIATTLSSSSLTLNENSKTNQNNAVNLLTNMESVTQSMQELQQAANDISNHVENAVQEISDVNTQGQQLSEEINTMNGKFIRLKELSSSNTKDVAELNANVEGIHGILQTIQSIAEQTNLLALNAAIEAARAGEQGRGFAVVADEVRNLAAKTQQSTEEIQVLIANLKDSADRSISAMEESTQATEVLAEELGGTNSQVLSLFDRLMAVNDLNDKISFASQEQVEVISSISELTSSATSLAESSNQAATSAHQQSEQLAQYSAKLSELTKSFRFE